MEVVAAGRLDVGLERSCGRAVESGMSLMAPSGGFVYRAPLPVCRSALFSSTLLENDNELPVEQITAQHPSGV